MLTLIIVFLSRILYLVEGIECYSCTQKSFTDESVAGGDCFNVDSASTSSSSTSANYCMTVFSFNDGIVKSIIRDMKSGSMPTNYCRASINPEAETHIEESTCIYYCDDVDKCNNVGVSSLKRCSTDCGRSGGFGKCDYLTGTCYCDGGFSGHDCGTMMHATELGDALQCIQCSSEVIGYEECKSQKIGSECSGHERYCFAARKSLFTIGRLFVRTSIIRGCTDEFHAVDDCRFSDVPKAYDLPGRNYFETTCYSTCDTDNCNEKIPDGQMIEGEPRLLKCFECMSRDGDCNPAETIICPITATHCKTIVKYVISKAFNSSVKAPTPSSYKILSVVRECSMTSVKAECVETMVEQPLFKRVTCQESCHKDGCNKGWPARPKCIQCNGKTTDAQDTCINNPPQATGCSMPYEKYCYVSDEGVGQIRNYKGTIHGHPRKVERGCSYYDRGTRCLNRHIRGKVIQNCRHTCTVDGCNAGSQGFVPVQAFLAMLAITVLNMFFQLL